LDPSRTVPEGTLPSSERPVFVLAEPGLWSVSATVDDVGGETTVVATVIVTKHAEKPAPPPAPDWRKILGGLFRKLLRRS
jgi:hypothetical protein